MRWGYMEKEKSTSYSVLTSENTLFWRDILKVPFVNRKSAKSFNFIAVELIIIPNIKMQLIILFIYFMDFN